MTFLLDQTRVCTWSKQQEITIGEQNLIFLRVRMKHHKYILNLWETALSQEGDVTTKFLRISNVQIFLLTPSAEPLDHLKAVHEIPSI